MLGTQDTKSVFSGQFVNLFNQDKRPLLGAKRVYLPLGVLMTYLLQEAITARPPIYFLVLEIEL